LRVPRIDGFITQGDGMAENFRLVNPYAHYPSSQSFANSGTKQKPVNKSTSGSKYKNINKHLYYRIDQIQNTTF